MRRFCLVLTALLGSAAPALAQVTVDLHALDALSNAQPVAPKHAERKAVPKPAPRRVAVGKPQKPPLHAKVEQPTTAPQVTVGTPPPSPAPSTPAAQPPPAATLPAAPPPTVALVPVPPPAEQPAPPPPPPPISDAAASAATTTTRGLRVTFGAGAADLSPSSATAIKHVVQSAGADGDSTFNVVAYATGTPEDPSTARRLSLSRALAVRSALMANGVSSSHIYVRALGAAGGQDDPDRVDLAVLGGNAKSETQ